VKVPPSVRVVEATEVTPALLAAFARLVPQLSRSAPVPGARELASIAASPATVLLMAVDAAATGDRAVPAGAYVGTLTLALFPIPTGMRTWVEDVVVDERWRGRGVGAELTRAALERAAAAGARTVDLTSRPSREAANRLYSRLGFRQRQTNVYRIDLDA